MDECTSKYGYEVFYLIQKAFQSLPIAHVVNHSIFVVHGGLWRDEQLTIGDLQKIDRFNDPETTSPIFDMLWNDPMNGFGFRVSNRCENKQAMFFGIDVTDNFLNVNKLNLIVRSHQVQSSGFGTIQDGKCVTVFSAEKTKERLLSTCSTMKTKLNQAELFSSILFNLGEIY